MHRWSDHTRTPEALRPCVLSLGNFDGVHRGHKAVLGALVEAGARMGLPSVAVTFDPHPVAVLHPESAPELIAPSRVRDELIAETGVDGLLVIDFTAEFAQQSPEDFVREVFVRGLDARCVVVGMDTRFGYRNSGDVSTLADLGERLGFEVIALDDVGEGERYSSTVIRRELRDGDVAEAARILGRPHRVVGGVVHGNHRGRGLGYPTANLGPDSLGLVPAEGVYAGWLTRLDREDGEPDRTLPAALSVGTNPTFDTEDRRTVEAYVLDRDDLDLYDETVMVEFVEHIRPTLRFDSVEELTAAMAGDVERCRELLAKIVPA
ncbi:bifunctional riboflavin kinase/FAD synthetase [Phycicoccus sp. CSK15P-2]|uniref:bifunctional riboflavin kinase/FAD synthetase n=1 Tax=Phycicoccus sp. CSK15P-2 TaxID=2807627 RepID=UPI00194FA604|nr:bifunctional riboflavin kinase/FAD synthetase [Phycicoccus sp. CSK15P-2]MBM6404686.1 bifunctional riboflavin kinase/FAD synthetase [Phycicoccus sp. CSK15P-2]